MEKFEELDSLLHSQNRLAIISLLISLDEAEFMFLKEKTNTTSGNLSLQLEKLKKAEYIEINKEFKGKYPVTKCKITTKGKVAFEAYVIILKKYINIQ
jgi:DNA-binding transcriptional ArsR family regulator